MGSIFSSLTLACSTELSQSIHILSFLPKYSSWVLVCLLSGPISTSTNQDKLLSHCLPLSLLPFPISITTLAYTHCGRKKSQCYQGLDSTWGVSLFLKCCGLAVQYGDAKKRNLVRSLRSLEMLSLSRLTWFFQSLCQSLHRWLSCLTAPFQCLFLLFDVIHPGILPRTKMMPLNSKNFIYNVPSLRYFIMVATIWMSIFTLIHSASCLLSFLYFPPGHWSFHASSHTFYTIARVTFLM